MINIRPLYDRIVVKRIEEDGTRTAGGLFIPENAKEKPQQGEVIAVGAGKRTENGEMIPLDVKAGDLVLFGKFSGAEIKLNNTEYLIMREDEILGIVAEVVRTGD